MSNSGSTSQAAWVTELSDNIRGLPDRQATAIRLVYVHRVPVTEAAAWVGVSVKQMNGLLAAALKHIGTAMSPTAETA